MDLASAAAKKHANAKVDTMAVRLIVAEEIVLDSVEKNRRNVSGAPEQKLLQVLLQRKQSADIGYPETSRALKSQSE